jgi:DNA invertase Pin-like site-specific DNA recombinase
MFQVTGAFAEFERSMIKKRISGAQKGRRTGQAARASAHIPRDRKRIQALLRAKKGMLAIAKEVGVGSGTVQRIAREMRGERPFEDVNNAA